jgi:ribosomal protein L3
MAGRMGGEKCKRSRTRLEIVAEKNLLVIKGCVPDVTTLM